MHSRTTRIQGVPKKATSLRQDHRTTHPSFGTIILNSKNGADGPGMVLSWALVLACPGLRNIVIRAVSNDGTLRTIPKEHPPEATHRTTPRTIPQDHLPGPPPRTTRQDHPPAPPPRTTHRTIPEYHLPGPTDLPLPLKMLFPPLKEGSPFRERRLAVP